MSSSGNKITMRIFEKKKQLCSLCAIFREWEVILQVFMWGWLCWFAALLALFHSKALCKQQLIETDEVICVQNVLSHCYTLFISLEEARHQQQQQILSLNIGQAVGRTARLGLFLQFLDARERNQNLMRIVKLWKLLSREAGESPSLEIFKTWLGFGPNSIISPVLSSHGGGDFQSSPPAWTIPWLWDECDHSLPQHWNNPVQLPSASLRFSPWSRHYVLVICHKHHGLQ